MCCHVGGDIDFDAAGNLYLSTGDDTNPFDSAGYAPIDERTDRNPAYDAQRTAGNTNDLRGKILRIKVERRRHLHHPVAATCSRPARRSTRPEIYAMGFRNPFRMSVDKATGVVYLGDYGPDAGATDPNRGPGRAGRVQPGHRAGQLRLAVLHRHQHHRRDVQRVGLRHQQPPAPKYNCAGGPTNNSFRNTGLTTLPPAQPAWIRYAGDAGTPPEFGGGSESPMGGPVYRYNASRPRPPSSRSPSTGSSSPASSAAAGSSRSTSTPTAPAAPSTTFPWTGKQVMDLAFGPDGALYVLDYGTGYFNGDANSALYRYRLHRRRQPGADRRASANRTSGPAPLAVTFSSAGIVRPRGRRAHLLVGVRRRHHLDRGQPDARPTPPTAPTPRR